MHELAIAQAIIDIAVRHAAGRKVTRVEVKIGELRQVVPSALAFSFELVAQGTPVEGAELAMESMPVLTVCRTCAGESRQQTFPFQCASCASFDLQVVAGEELEVESLELVEIDDARQEYEDASRRRRA